MHPTEMLIRRLRAGGSLTDAGAVALADLPVQVMHVSADTPIVSEGEQPGKCCLLIEGFAYRSKVADSGKRQILSFHIAGDVPDLQSLFLERMDHDLTTFSRATLGFIQHSALIPLMADNAAIARALWRETLIDAAIFREWIVNVGARPGPARMAHLLLEMHERMTVVGLASGETFDFPITQNELADAVGLTPVHVNRILQALRANGVLELQGKRVSLINHAKVVAVAGFNADYLYLAKDPALV